jgi:hypothetical protein
MIFVTQDVGQHGKTVVVLIRPMAIPGHGFIGTLSIRRQAAAAKPMLPSKKNRW